MCNCRWCEGPTEDEYLRAQEESNDQRVIIWDRDTPYQTEEIIKSSDPRWATANIIRK